MGETLREIAVVGEEEKTFGLGIEPADIEEPRKISAAADRRSCRRACGSRRVETKPAGLCSMMVSASARPNEPVPDFDVVALFDLGAEIRCRAGR